MRSNQPTGLRLLFIGTSEFAVSALKAVLDHWQVCGVVTQPDRKRGRGRKLSPVPVKEFAIERGLPVYQPETSAELESLLNEGELAPDLIVVVAYGQFLTSRSLTVPPRGCINLHPSLLPSYRGAAPIQRVVLGGETDTGVTTMYLDSGMDAGDLILQESCLVPEGCTSGELSELLAERGSALLLKTINLIELGAAPRLPQDQHLVSYAPPLTTGEERICWENDGLKLYNLIRGMNPAPVAYTLFKGKIIKIWRSELLPGNSEDIEPGMVASLVPGRGFVVQTGCGRLLVTEVQPAGKSRMNAGDFLRGYQLAPGTRLGE